MLGSKFRSFSLALLLFSAIVLVAAARSSHTGRLVGKPCNRSNQCFSRNCALIEGSTTVKQCQRQPIGGPCFVSSNCLTRNCNLNTDVCVVPSKLKGICSSTVKCTRGLVCKKGFCAKAPRTTTTTTATTTSVTTSTTSSTTTTVVPTGTKTDTDTITETSTPSPQPPVTSHFVFAVPDDSDLRTHQNGLSQTFSAPCTGTASAILDGGAGGFTGDQGWRTPGYTVTSAVVVGGSSTIPSGTVFAVQVGGSGHTNLDDDNGAGGWPNGGAARGGAGGGGSSELIVQATGERVVIAGGGGGNGASYVADGFVQYYGSEYPQYVFNNRYPGQPEDDSKLMSSSTGGTAGPGQENTGGGGGGLLGGQAGEDGNGGYAGSSKGDSIIPGSRWLSGQVTVTFTCTS